jgi:hypothetical protein
MSTKLGLKFYAAVALFTVLLFPPHEFAHYVAYRALGIPVQMTLNTASPADPTQRRVAGELAGPALNLLVAIGAFFAFRRAETGRLWWAALALSSSMTRLVIYAIVIIATGITGSTLSMGNDEPIAANLLSWPGLSFVLVFAPLFATVAWLITADLGGSRLARAGRLVAAALVVFCIGLLVGQVIDPWLFPRT